MKLFGRLFGKKTSRVSDAQRNEARKSLEVLNETLFEVAMSLYNKGDYNNAFKQMKVVAEQGEHADAMFNLGMFYLRGIGVEVDVKAGMEWLEIAAANGDAKAAYNIAIAYHDGKIVSRDMDEARRWYEVSAKLGDQRAQTELMKLRDDPYDAATNLTHSYEPFIFAGVRFKDVFDLLDCCDGNQPRNGKYFIAYIETPPCFDEFDRAAVGREATFYVMSGDSAEEADMKKYQFFISRIEQFTPVLKVDRTKEGYLEKTMTIYQ